MEKEVVQWDLTPDEATQLHGYHLRRMGLSRLLIKLQETEGAAIEGEQDWWDAVVLRLGIPDKFRHKLFASHETHKVWVKEKWEVR